ncbi:MAG: AI-2E family transporter [Clostridia bacterium]|nr:AI-2E family transporter [Clostridia bacterium]
MENRLSFRQILTVVALGALILVGLMNLSVVLGVIAFVIRILSPFIYAGIAAAVINVLMSAIEKGILAISRKKPPKEGLVTAVSLILSVIIVIALLAGVVLLIIPQFASAIPMIINSIKANWGTISEFLSNINVDPSGVYSLLTNMDTATILQKLTSGIGDVFGTVISAVSSITGGIFTAIISIVACIYMLVSKKTLSRQLKRLVYAYTKENIAEKTVYFFSTLSDTFKRFLSSQCIDAFILGALLFITMLVLRLPYAGVISALTVIFALIPYFGAFFSCALGAFFIVLIDPQKALIFVIVFIIVQQLEGNLIYPKIVGTSVGLPALWTLVAVYVGGQLFGVIGMILFIPIVSVIYTILSENIKKRLDEKKENDNEAVL